MIKRVCGSQTGGKSVLGESNIFYNRDGIKGGTAKMTRSWPDKLYMVLTILPET